MLTVLLQQRRNGGVIPPQSALMCADKLRHWWDTHGEEVRRADTALLNMHLWLSAVPNLTPSDVIGDGGFVYHIWQDSDTARLGIGRERPSFTKSLPSGALQTKRVLTGVGVQNKPSRRLLEWGFTSSAVILTPQMNFNLKCFYCDEVFLFNIYLSIKINAHLTVKHTPARDPPLAAYKSHRRCSPLIGCLLLSITQRCLPLPLLQ